MVFDWSDFYTAQSGRGVRPTFTSGLEAWQGDRPGDAIDLGCGDGIETLRLAENGWHVVAIDADPDVEKRVGATVGAELADRVEVRCAAFESLGALPESDFVYAGFALPFCDAGHFPYLWADLRDALRPGAVFAGQLFGPHDEWYGRPGMNFHDRAGVEAMLTGLDVVELAEEDRRGMSFEGPKHWHVFHIVARA
ncbi:class I SAM-dependent methyltransferase [Kitasatospora herbaricolor]|uniref:class I SAM-dependent methyltransferase n=1 Tax=Kitasatospora herbaricolor TaxID=68217 RepID=UPI0036DD9FB6